MKICLVNNLYPPVAQGGTEVVVQTTIELLLAAGHEVVLITTHPSNIYHPWALETDRGFSLYRFRPRNIYYYTDGPTQPVWKKILWHALDIANPFDKKAITSILLKEKPDLVHGHNLKGMSYTLPGICTQLGIPYIHTLHNYQLLHPYGTFLATEHPPYWRPKIVSRLYQLLNRRMFRKVQAVISPSALPLQLHEQVGFFSSASTTILPSPILTPTRSQKYEYNTTLRFVFLGAIEEIKGIRVLLDAWKGLQNNDCVLDIYGQGTLRMELEEKSQAMTNVHWRGHLADLEQLAKYDALIYPSTCYETQGLSMAVALSRGTPVIASRIGSLPETITDGKNGRLFTSGHAGELQRLLAECINRPERLRQLRDAALTSAQRFNLQEYSQKLQAWYEALRVS